MPVLPVELRVALSLILNMDSRQNQQGPWTRAADLLLRSRLMAICLWKNLRQCGILAAGVFVFGGCKATREMVVEEAPVPGRDIQPAAAPDSATRSARVLQQAVMDFSDHYVSGLWLAFDEYIKNETDPAKRTNAQKWKVMLGATSMTIAGSQDPRAALLDMTVFISAGKWAVDRHWIPGVFGERAASLRVLYREMNRKIWEEAEKVLTPAQQSDLRSLIVAWEETDPPRNQLLDVRLRNLDGVVLSNFAEARSARGLMASIQRLLGKVDQSLLYGERVLFYMERVPRMLAQQSDLTIDRVAERFPIATINPDFSSLSAMAANLPQQINDALQDKEGVVGKALPEIRTSLESAERLSLTLQETFDSVNLLATKIEALPFERDDYAQAWQQTSTTLTQLNSFVNGLNQLLDSTTAAGPEGARLAQMVDERADRLLDKAFQRGLILIGVFFGGVLVSLVVARVIFRRTPPQSLPADDSIKP